MNNTDHLDKVIKEEYTSQLENQRDIYKIDNQPNKVLVLNDRASEEMIDAVSKQQFLSIRDIEESQNRGD